jgi:hypothetical protein
MRACTGPTTPEASRAGDFHAARIDDKPLWRRSCTALVLEVRMIVDPPELIEQTEQTEERDDPDEALDDAAQGHGGTSDEAADGTGEIDAMGAAAGLVVRNDRPFRGIDAVERRDEHRWELDPASAVEDASQETGRG